MSQWNGPGRLGSWWLVTGALTLLRAGYGVGLVCAPRWLLRVAGDAEPSGRACGVARVLGVRHLAQAVLTTAARCANPASRAPVACGAGVDLLHASTMVGLAAVDREARRVALVDAGVESTLGLAGIVAAGRSSGSHGRDMSGPAGQWREHAVK